MRPALQLLLLCTLAAPLARAASILRPSHDPLQTAESPARAPLRFMDSDKESLWMVHMPKTAVVSLCYDLKQTGEINLKRTGEVSKAGALPGPGFPLTCIGNQPGRSQVLETCHHKVVEYGGTFIGTLFRDPFSLVISLYSECAFDVGYTMIRSTYSGERVPGTPSAAALENPFNPVKFNTSAFDEWLDHFDDDTWSPPGNDYDCYHPWNMQARHFQPADVVPCADPPGGSQAEVHHLYDRSGLTPDAAYASSLVSNDDAVAFVGLTGLYDESWCLLKYQMHGTLPSEKCDCASFGQEGLHADYSHSDGIVRPTPAELPQATFDLIDEYTKVDQQLYAVAVSRTLGQLCAVQQATGQQLLCPERIDHFRNSSRHLVAIAGVVDVATRACLQPSMRE